VHDITDLEVRGIPGVMVASTEFIDAADAQIAALGMEVARVFIQHPIQDRTDDEVNALAEAAIQELIAAITS